MIQQPHDTNTNLTRGIVLRGRSVDDCLCVQSWREMKFFSSRKGKHESCRLSRASVKLSQTSFPVFPNVHYYLEFLAYKKSK